MEEKKGGRREKRRWAVSFSPLACPFPSGSVAGKFTEIEKREEERGGKKKKKREMALQLLLHSAFIPSACFAGVSVRLPWKEGGREREEKKGRKGGEKKEKHLSLSTQQLIYY